MAVLGKRKARPAPVPPAEQQQQQQQQSALDVFRRHFESRFEPLSLVEPLPQSPLPSDQQADCDAESDEWSGLSDNGLDPGGRDGNGGVEEEQTPPAVQVVDYAAVQPPPSSSAAMSKRDFKAFMSSRPPDHAVPAVAAPSAPSSSSAAALPEDAPSLLAQDLELRRLLAESHLLSPHPSAAASAAPGTTATPRTFTAGRVRHKATDLRIQALGSTVSILKQDKMPMNMRKGIVGAAASREAKRRREARENGVILERESSNKRRRDSKRHGAVDRPGVGRLKGAELRLTERDVKSIEGARDTFGRRRARGR